MAMVRAVPASSLACFLASASAWFSRRFWRSTRVESWEPVGSLTGNSTCAGSRSSLLAAGPIPW
jgi:hypothetical protein